MRALSFCLGSSILALTLLAGCGLKGEGLSSEGQAITADEDESDESVTVANGLASVPALSLGEGTMTLSTAVEAQASAGTFLQPEGCLTTSTSGNVVTYAFHECTGPWGKVTLSGDEVATFAPGDAPGSVNVHLESDELTVDGRPLDHHADAAISFGGGKRIVDWKGQYDGTTAKGRPIHHTSDLVFGVPVDGSTACTTLDGQTDTKIGTRGLTIDYQDVVRCGGARVCPEGTVVATGDVSHYEVTLTFDGSNVAQATGPRGGELDVPLKCTPATASE